MSEYEVMYHNVEDGEIWMSKGIVMGIRTARKTAYETYNEESKYSEIEVKICLRSGYPIETINRRTVLGEEM